MKWDYPDFGGVYRWGFSANAALYCSSILKTLMHHAFSLVPLNTYLYQRYEALTFF